MGPLPLQDQRSKSPGALTVRDNNDWVSEFQRIVAARLKKIFEQDLDRIPKKHIEQLKQLHLAEERRRKSEPQ
jgi:hypothetical protein